MCSPDALFVTSDGPHQHPSCLMTTQELRKKITQIYYKFLLT